VASRLALSLSLFHPLSPRTSSHRAKELGHQFFTLCENFIVACVLFISHRSAVKRVFNFPFRIIMCIRHSVVARGIFYAAVYRVSHVTRNLLASMGRLCSALWLTHFQVVRSLLLLLRHDIVADSTFCGTLCIIYFKRFEFVSNKKNKIKICPFPPHSSFCSSQTGYPVFSEIISLHLSYFSCLLPVSLLLLPIISLSLSVSLQISSSSSSVYVSELKKS
jgi:hypothetical protein